MLCVEMKCAWVRCQYHTHFSFVKSDVSLFVSLLLMHASQSTATNETTHLPLNGNPAVSKEIEERWGPWSSVNICCCHFILHSHDSSFRPVFLALCEAAHRHHPSWSPAQVEFSTRTRFCRFLFPLTVTLPIQMLPPPLAKALCAVNKLVESRVNEVRQLRQQKHYALLSTAWPSRCVCGVYLFLSIQRISRSNFAIRWFGTRNLATGIAVILINLWSYSDFW